MLRTNIAPQFARLGKILPSKVLEKRILTLPFNQIEKGILNLNLLGQSYRFEGKQRGHHAELSIINPIRAYWLIKTQGELGFAQAYYEGAIDTTSLYELLYVGSENRQAFQALLSHKSLNLLELWRHRRNKNSLGNSRRNISYHYDLGNDFYQLWLDETMSYSSALFQVSDQHNTEPNTHTLALSQQRKYQNIIDNVGIKPGQRVLEIGCGWGGFMDESLAQNVHVTGLTLSKEQRLFALQRLATQYASDQYDIKLQDYRLEEQQYDHIVSIEMFEAVGKEYWDEYFETLKRCLKPDGKIGIQVITIADEKAESYQKSVDFIQAYIFPGGLLPSVSQIHQYADKHGFDVEQNQDFGADYGVTCQLWKQAFNKQSSKLEALGYDSAFQRLWNYYLDYCTVGFETKEISVNQFVLTRGQS